MKNKILHWNFSILFLLFFVEIYVLRWLWRQRACAWSPLSIYEFWQSILVQLVHISGLLGHKTKETSNILYFQYQQKLLLYWKKKDKLNQRFEKKELFFSSFHFCFLFNFFAEILQGVQSPILMTTYHNNIAITKSFMSKEKHRGRRNGGV